MRADRVKTFPILGTPLSAIDYAELSHFLIERSAQFVEPYAVDFSNTHILTMRRHSPGFSAITSCIDLFCPDGMPLVWAMDRLGANLKNRVYGPTFTREFLSSAPSGSTHYLIGGSEDCGRRFRLRMLQLNPAIQFVGGYHGYCSSDGVLEDEERIHAEILLLKPDFIWIGLGTPKQYYWLARIKPLLSRGILLAVGFAFDVNAGTKSDAPMWMQKRGLTWAHRMACEPSRLGARYLKWNTLFLCYLLRDALMKLCG